MNHACGAHEHWCLAIFSGCPSHCVSPSLCPTWALPRMTYLILYQFVQAPHCVRFHPDIDIMQCLSVNYRNTVDQSEYYTIHVRVRFQIFINCPDGSFLERSAYGRNRAQLSGLVMKFSQSPPESALQEWGNSGNSPVAPTEAGFSTFPGASTVVTLMGYTHSLS